MAHSLFMGKLSTVAGIFVLSAGVLPAFAQVEMQQAGSDHIAITVNGRPFSDFYFGANYPKPFLAPLRTASGLVVTRKYPMENVEGESRDHQHHRGLFIGHGEINGLNFWENEFKYQSNAPKNFNAAKNGRMVLRKLNEVKSGKKSGKIEAAFDWAGPDGALILEEKRTMTFYADPEDERIFDVDFTLTAKKTAQFADTKEGFFAIRIADSMTEKNGGLMTNSEGAETEKKVWGKPANWVDYDGTVEGQKVGIAIFDHPGNYNHPERWHSRAYGLFAVNPFGLKDFEPKTEAQGGYTIKTGDALRFRYRVIIYPGDMPKKKLDDLYSEYAKKGS
ncbi:MAG: PmoA family protein [Bryobacteraceae bacterium]